MEHFTQDIDKNMQSKQAAVPNFIYQQRQQQLTPIQQITSNNIMHEFNFVEFWFLSYA